MSMYKARDTLVQMVLTWCLKFSSTSKYTPKNLTAGVLDKLSILARGVQRAGSLKVPKREIFDRSDFPDFYTIKSLREGDFGVKI